MMDRQNPFVMALAGLRIIDLARARTAFCPRLLADLGAEVIKVEPPGGDPSRKIGPFFRDAKGNTRSLSFFYDNANKLSITLDLENPKGRSIFQNLVSRADACVEAFSPGYLEGLGLGYKDLRRINPRLILVTITGYGRDGHRKGYKSCDLVACALGGQMYVTGSPSKPPLKPFGEQSYFSASLFAALGILAAIREREESGEGDHLDISLQETVTATLEHALVNHLANQPIPGRRGPRHWNDSFTVFPCKDGHIHLSLFLQWETLVEWLDSEGMAEDLVEEKWNDPSYRLAHADHIIEVLSRWTSTHNVKELFELGQMMHFPWAPVQAPTDIVHCPQLETRDFFVTNQDDDRGVRLKWPGLPFKFSSGLSRPQRVAPEPGEHNIRIYQQLLGLTREEISKLNSEGII